MLNAAYSRTIRGKADKKYDSVFCLGGLDVRTKDQSVPCVSRPVPEKLGNPPGLTLIFADECQIMARAWDKTKIVVFTL